MASTARIDELKKKFDENPRRYFAPLANEFRKAGDIEQAIIICEEFLPQQPGHMSGHIVYGQALYEAGRMPESRTVFETALGLDPENLIALRHLGDIAKLQGDEGVAREWYNRVLEADPRNEEIQSLIATLAPPESAEQAAPAPEAQGVTLDMEEEFVALDAASFASLAVDDTPSAAAPRQSSAQYPADAELEDTHPLGVPIVSPDAAAPSPQLIDSFEVADALPGAQHAGLLGLESAADSALPSLPDDLHLDDGLLAAPHGDPVAPHDHWPEAAQPRGDELVLDAGWTSPVPEPAGNAAWVGGQSDGLAHDSEARAEDWHVDAVEAANTDIPVELPPQVIAAEAELTEEADVPVASPPFVTETMAELYVAQGFREEARAVYTQLLANQPDNARLRGLVDSLAPIDEPVHAGPNVRDFFARLAARRPGQVEPAAQLPDDDDFAPPADSSLEPETEWLVDTPTDASAVDAFPQPGENVPADATPEPEQPRSDGAVAPAVERAARMLTPAGSIDALFGNRPASNSEDTAAAALAQAFGTVTGEQPIIVGRAAHAASAELSLDSVFRDGPARPPRGSQSFSFDQFFSGASATTPRTSGSVKRQTTEVPAEEPAPADRNADDIDAFNAWLQGLKPR